MVNVHPCDNDKTKVLLEIDVYTLMIMMAAWGSNSVCNTLEMLEQWGFPSAEAQRINRMAEDAQFNNVSNYYDTKMRIIQYYCECVGRPYPL